MFAVAECTGSLSQGTRSTVSVDSSQHRFAHEGASAPWAGDGINLGDDRIVKLNLHSHVHTK